MQGVAASSELANAAYVPPFANLQTVGTATFHFLKMPLNFQLWEFLGIVFILFVISRHWGRFINDVAG